MLMVSDWIQIPSKTANKDSGITGKKQLIILLANTAFEFPVVVTKKLIYTFLKFS